MDMCFFFQDPKDGHDLIRIGCQHNTVELWRNAIFSGEACSSKSPWSTIVCSPSACVSKDQQQAICVPIARITARQAGSDGCIQVYIGCCHPIQTWAPGHQVNLWPIQTLWPRLLATEFQLAIDLLGGPATKFGSDGRIQCIPIWDCDPSQHCWQWRGLKYACWIKLVIEAQIALILSLSHQTLRFEFQEQRTAHLTFTDDQIHKEIQSTPS
jgi:hypothetical protein